MILEHFDGWVYEGWEHKGYERLEPASDGINGIVRCEQKATQVTASAKCKNILRQQSTQQEDETDVNVIADGDKKANKINECMQKLSNLRSKRAKSLDKIREIDELRSQADGDFKKMKQELENSVVNTRAEENISIENRFSQAPASRNTDIAGNFSPTTEFIPTALKPDVAIGTPDGISRAAQIQKILSKIENIDVLKAAEDFMKVRMSCHWVNFE